MNTAEARARATLFEIAERGAIVVSGDDRERWLNGMVSNDVAALTPEPARSGCYAALLTPQGRIVADLHVLHRGEAYWLEQSPEDPITTFDHAEKAKTTLEKLGAKVHLESYEGGHGWHGDLFGRLKRGFAWLEENHAPPQKISKKKSKKRR